MFVNKLKMNSVAEAVKEITEKELSAKQKQIAKIEHPKDKIDAGDLASLRAGKKPVKEESVDEAKSLKISTPTGTKVLGHSYGDSASAHRSQTKSSVDDIKGPKDSEINIYKKDTGQKRNYKVHAPKYFSKVISGGEKWKSKDEPRYKNEETEIDEAMSGEVTRTKTGLVHRSTKAYGGSKPEKHVVDTLKGPKEKDLIKKDVKDELKNRGRYDEEMEFKNKLLEALKGKQHKIDKNKNNKIDAQDFAMLRAQQKEELELDESSCEDEAKQEVKKHEKKMHGKDGEVSKHVEKMHKEEVELDEKAGYSAKAARAGKDIGKPGKAFSMIAKKAGERYGSAEAGKRVAGAILAKLRKEEADADWTEEQADAILEYYELEEKKMTDAEMAKREKIVKSMKKGFAGFRQRYGKDAKSVMYATATKQAMKEDTVEEEIDPKVRTKDTLKGQEPTAQKDDVGPGSDAKSTKVKFRGGPMKEEVKKSDIPAFIRKARGDKPLTVADAKAGSKDSISSKENLAKARGVTEGKHPESDTVPFITNTDQPPFDKPYTKIGSTVTDKSGAKHTPMSRARDLARQAMKRIKTEMLGKAPGNNG